ncbi:GDP dissociation inhibitor [Carpediemonas membranifera]|uniref:Rab GDP dissociation inhibitor n=1 Tax=Carpediemonas membranifera TaxID=201153 RepID=A0A8J6E199_9EUKA|nr:GDP dissociation inhibitor [Carpediemonas membranifera]|eukprot:KAG9393203.1 GDP dissociation inhibitor [Carpediemonas membranifera]
MQEHYDFIILGTGLKECLLSGLLSVHGKKVLHMDRNDYYGGASASLTLEQLFEQQGKGEAPPAELGRSREWSIDIVPKYLLAGGRLVKALTHTNVTRYLDFMSVQGSYVTRKGKVRKVPATAGEALKSSLMGPFEKRRMAKFLEFVRDFDPEKPETAKGLDLKAQPMSEVWAKFKLEPDTVDFLGHAMGLYLTDEYLERPGIECVDRIRLYVESLARFGNSPYIYPQYGIGDLPQAFARLSAIYGGVYMMRKPIEEILFNEDGTVRGIKSEGEEATCDVLIGDPSYFSDYVEATEKIVRAICILQTPIAGTTGSAQIIMPQKQLGRKNDVYVTAQTHDLMTVAKNYLLGFASTTVETENPEAELQPAFDLMGPILHKFVTVSDYLVPVKEKLAGKKIYVTSSYDATSHFETTIDDVIKIYEEVSGEVLDLDAKIAQPGVDQE